jgi:hypothetical protein
MGESHRHKPTSSTSPGIEFVTTRSSEGGQPTLEELGRAYIEGCAQLLELEAESLEARQAAAHRRAGGARSTEGGGAEVEALDHEVRRLRERLREVRQILDEAGGAPASERGRFARGRPRGSAAPGG